MSMPDFDSEYVESRSAVPSRDVRPTYRITYRNPKRLLRNGFSRLAVRAVRSSQSGSRKNVTVLSQLAKWMKPKPSNTFADMDVNGSIFTRVRLRSTYRTYRTYRRRRESGSM